MASPDGDGKLRLWLAPLDRRSPPRQIPNIEGEQPVFGATGEVFFRRVEGTSAFLYRVQEDGGELRKAIDVPIVGLSGESPDRNWLALGSGGVVIFRVDGGAPLRTQIRASATTLSWSGDGKHLFVQGKGAGKPGQGLRLAIVPGPNGARKYRPWASVRAGDLEAARSAGHSFEERCARPDCGYIRLHARERAAQPVSDSRAVIRRLEQAVGADSCAAFRYGVSVVLKSCGSLSRG